jgi:hypothetical protein
MLQQLTFVCLQQQMPLFGGIGQNKFEQQEM